MALKKNGHHLDSCRQLRSGAYVSDLPESFVQLFHGTYLQGATSHLHSVTRLAQVVRGVCTSLRVYEGAIRRMLVMLRSAWATARCPSAANGARFFIGAHRAHSSESAPWDDEQSRQWLCALINDLARLCFEADAHNPSLIDILFDDMKKMLKRRAGETADDYEREASRAALDDIDGVQARLYSIGQAAASLAGRIAGRDADEEACNGTAPPFAQSGGTQEYTYAVFAELSADFDGLCEWFLEGENSPFLHRARYVAAEDIAVTYLKQLLGCLAKTGHSGSQIDVASLGNDLGAFVEALDEFGGSANGTVVLSAVAKLFDAPVETIDDTVVALSSCAADSAAALVVARLVLNARSVSSKSFEQVEETVMAHDAMRDDARKRGGAPSILARAVAHSHTGGPSSEMGSSTSIESDPIAGLDTLGEANELGFTLRVQVSAARDVPPNASVAVKLHIVSDGASTIEKPEGLLIGKDERGLTLDVPDPFGFVLSCDVSQKDRLGRRRVVGEATVSLVPLREGVEHHDWYPLNTQDPPKDPQDSSQEAATLRLCLTLEAKSPPTRM